MHYRMWRVIARVAWKTQDGWNTSQGCPTFYLDGDELGIVDAEHAERIAMRVVDPTSTAAEISVTVAAPGDWT